MTFAEFDLAPTILQGVQACGFTGPTPIQARAIPEALAGRDLMASAQTGTGKTAAFMLPALQRLATLKKGPKGAPRVLVLTPTRELAAQVLETTRTYGRHLRLRCAVLLGGTPYRDQFRALAQPIDLVVATPGRLVDHLERGSLTLSRLELLILDEGDRMLDMGFRPDVERITAAAPAGRQTLLFTATLDRAMAELAAGLLKDPVRIDIAGRVAPAAGIEQRLHVADNLQHKHRLLQSLVTDGKLNQAIIFAATKRDADTLARDLAARGHRAAALHGDMTQGARNRTVQDLRRGRIQLLVATDVAARGLDVNTVSHVINFDLPKFAEDYVHRIGRTGRAGATGIAISLAAAGDLPALQRIQRYLGHEVPQHILPGLEPTRPLATRQTRDGARSGPGRNRSGRPGGGPGHRTRRGRTGNGNGKPRRETVIEARRSR